MKPGIFPFFLQFIRSSLHASKSEADLLIHEIAAFRTIKIDRFEVNKENPEPPVTMVSILVIDDHSKFLLYPMNDAHHHFVQFCRTEKPRKIAIISFYG